MEEAQESVIANFTNNNLRQPAVAGATIAVQPSTNVSVNPHPDGTQKAFHQALRDSNLGHMITESVRHQTLLAGVNEMEREDPPSPAHWTSTSASPTTPGSASPDPGPEPGQQTASAPGRGKTGTGPRGLHSPKPTHQGRDGTLEIFLYSLSFIPLLLLTLTVHELGHLAAARLLGVRTSGFQIGVGWKLATVHTGSTRIQTQPSTPVLNPTGAPPAPGDLMAVYLEPQQDPQEPHRASALMHLTSRVHPRGPEAQAIREHNESHLRLTGRVRETHPDHLVLADMAWSLRALPFMAAVFLPEDPGRSSPGLLNTSPWTKQVTITLAGSLANIVLMALVLALLAAFPVTSVRTSLLEVIQVLPASPAEQAGLQVGDHIVQADHHLMPTQDQFRDLIQKAHANSAPVDLEVLRQGTTVPLSVTPNWMTGTIGVTITLYTPPPRTRPLDPASIGHRFISLGSVYFNSAASLATSVRREDQQHTPQVSGPIMGAHQTAQAIRYAGLKAWLAILAAITMSVAILNLLPIPPLDGYRLVIQSVEALRHGQPVSPKFDQAMTLCGLTAIAMCGIYLTYTDIMHLLE